MIKHLSVTAVLALLSLAGCTSTTPAENTGVTVLVGPDGVLESQGFTLKPADLQSFAKEVGGNQVVLIPLNNPSYAEALKAKEELKAAGVSKVVIGRDAGG
jgi:predicted xylose isomerase-like sugar epimerase